MLRVFIQRAEEGCTFHVLSSLKQVVYRMDAEEVNERTKKGKEESVELSQNIESQNIDFYIVSTMPVRWCKF